MRTVYICRHAKSSWADPGMADFDRPLNARGERDAPAMAAYFKARNEMVDLLVSSTAVRALATARCYAQALGATEVRAFDPDAPLPQLLLRPELYHPTVPAILHLLNHLPAAVNAVMLFGHNPGFTEVVEYLSSEHIGNLPTCGIVRIDFPLDDWAHVSRDLGTLVWMDHPKRYPELR